MTVNGRIDRDGDEDLFRISAEAGASLLFQVDAEKYGSLLDSSLTLLDARARSWLPTMMPSGRVEH